MFWLDIAEIKSHWQARVLIIDRVAKIARRNKKEEESCSDKLWQTGTGAKIDAVELAKWLLAGWQREQTGGSGKRFWRRNHHV